MAACRNAVLLALLEHSVGTKIVLGLCVHDDLHPETDCCYLEEVFLDPLFSCFIFCPFHSLSVRFPVQAVY